MAYKVRFVNPQKHYQEHRKEYLAAINNVLARGDLILRKDVEDFEKKFASLIGVKYAVGLNSGTDALFFALIAAGIKPGDEVITVAHTFVASVAAIAHLKANPVLVDVGEDFLIDTDKIEKAITKKTKAIMPVHLNGRVCDMEKIMKIAKKYNLAIIEDAAQAIGAKYKGKMAGSFGLAGCFSMYPFKILGAFGDAGALTTNNKELAEKIRLLRDHCQKTLEGSRQVGTYGAGKTELVCYGFNSRLDNLQAAVLNVKLKFLPKWIKRRRGIANLYYQGLLGVSRIKLPPKSDKNHFDTYQNYVILAQKRDKLYSYLKEKGVETLIKDPIALHRQKPLKLSHFLLPVTEKLAEEVISLPCYPELKNNEVKYTIDCIKRFYA